MSSGPARTFVDAVGRELDGGIDPLAAIEQASAEGLPIRAAALALARYARGGRTPSRLLGEVLRWVDPATLGPLVACAEAEGRVDTLLDLVADDEIVGSAACSLLLFATLVSEGDGPSAGRLRAWLRTYARTRHPVEDGRALVVAAGLLAERDPAFHAAFTEIADPRWSADREALAQVLATHQAALLPSALEQLPADETETVGAVFTVRRVTDKVGRNDACPCGSGKKYKKCCAEKDAARAQSPSLRAGYTRDELLRDGAGSLTPKDIAALPEPDLPRIDRARLEPEALAALQARALELAAWPLVVEVTVALTAYAELEAPALERAVSGLLGRGRAADVRTILERTGTAATALVPGDRLALAAATGASADLLTELEAFAQASLREEPDHSDIEIPYALRHRHPGLAILLARGTLDPQRGEDSRAMLELVEELRDRLALRPFDPGTELYELQRAAQVGFDHEQRARGRAEREALDAKEQVDALRHKIDDSLRRTSDAEQRLREQEQALRATSSSAAPDGEEQRRLRAKIDALKGLVAEGNEERRTLRAEVERAQRANAADDAPGPSEAEEPDAEEPGEGATRPRGVHVPSFGKDAERFLRDAPQRIAHDALVCVAELAAGDELRWSEVKQLARPTVVAYSGRIGIHYRFIFHLEPGRLVVDEIVHRKDLEAAVRRAMAP